ncbi:rRNA processing/ribosome biogenesis-domain-containing protein [Trametes meyenii]|nr:rRNA processing/ribosome biogenesis-domain-containing protein [Trametes meyenii]
MKASHRLRDLLQLQLASDSYAVLHLPFVLDTLSKEDLQPSAHTQKWIARVNSLIHSKDPGAKWSGLCLAFQTAVYSKAVMLECAQSWVAAAMSLLVNQPAPTTKSAIRLLRLIFSNAIDVPEFQRQICLPHVPKFGNALIAIAEKEANTEVKIVVLDTLAHIVSLYPSLCRPLHAALSNTALRHLNGSSPNPTPDAMVEACSRLYCVLPLTGGKVGATGLWRKSLDDTIAFAWGALIQLRSTYPDQAYAKAAPLAEDPIIGIPLALDRLRAGVQVISDLLRATASRPVLISIGPLVRLCLALFQCETHEKTDPMVDPVVRSLEDAVVPALSMLACGMLVPLAQTCRHHLTPHLPALLSHLTYHLEQPQSPVRSVRLLRTAQSILENGLQLHDKTLSSRLARATMPLLTVILSERTQVDVENEQGVAHGRSKKGKKRARGYEGDEVFKVGRKIICPTPEEGDLLLVSVDVLENLLLRAQVNPPVHSIASRLLLSIYASLPQLPPAMLSSDLSLHPRLYSKLQLVCAHLAIGTTSTMSKALGIVLSVSGGTLGEINGISAPTEIDLLLHPRVPPLVRSLPHVEMLSLFRAEESQEESDTRTNVGLGVVPDESDIAELLAPTVNVLPRETLAEVAEATRNASRPQVQAQKYAAMQVDVAPPAAPSAVVAKVAEPSIPSALAVPAMPPAAASTLENFHVPPSSLPPPPDPLPSSTAASGPRSTTIPAPPTTPTAPPPMPTEEEADDDDDEPMPTIDMGSDSDSE